MSGKESRRGGGRVPGSGKAATGRGHGDRAPGLRHATGRGIPGSRTATGRGLCGAGSGRGYTSNALLDFGLSQVGFGEDRRGCSENLNHQRFRSHFTVGPHVIRKLIALMMSISPGEEINLIYLFMAICWLTLYEKEHVMAGRWGYGEKHCREKVQEYVRWVAKLKPMLINFDNLSPKCKFAPVDGVHRQIQEMRADPSSKYWSHKFNGPAIGWEVVTNPTDKGLMLWANGPFPAATHDLTCLRGGKKGKQSEWKKSSLYNSMPDGLRLVGDSAYGGQFDKVTCTMDAHSAKTKELFARMKSMQETIFKRFKDFMAIREPFRHGKNTQDKLDKAAESFDACAVLIQLDIANGRPLFDV